LACFCFDMISDDDESASVLSSDEHNLCSLLSTSLCSPKIEVIIFNSS
jgi:hypothetical protein